MSSGAYVPREQCNNVYSLHWEKVGEGLEGWGGGKGLEERVREKPFLRPQRVQRCCLVTIWTVKGASAGGLEWMGTGWWWWGVRGCSGGRYGVRRGVEGREGGFTEQRISGVPDGVLL